MNKVFSTDGLAFWKSSSGIELARDGGQVREPLDYLVNTLVEFIESFGLINLEPLEISFCSFEPVLCID